jgi:hypothetical protein
LLKEAEDLPDKEKYTGELNSWRRPEYNEKYDKLRK